MTYDNFGREIAALAQLVKMQDQGGKFEEAEYNRRLLESKIAAHVIASPSPQTWSAIDKVSEALVSLLTTHQTALQSDTTLHQSIKHLINDLHSEVAFGRLVLNKNNDIQDRINGEFIIDLLKNSRDLPLVMHVHALLGQHLVMPLLNLPQPQKEQVKTGNETLATLAAKLIEKTPTLRAALRSKFYLYKDRGRFESKESIPSTTQIGIMQDSAANIGEYHPAHARAADRCTPDTNHAYYQQYIQNSSLPFVAGPSGHAGIMFRTAVMAAHLPADEMKHYALGAMAMIVGGGMHTTHEIMLMFKQLGFQYEAGDYDFILDLLQKDKSNELIHSTADLSASSTTLSPSFNQMRDLTKALAPSLISPKDINNESLAKTKPARCFLL